jgi:hypothetical protein
MLELVYISVNEEKTTLKIIILFVFDLIEIWLSIAPCSLSFSCSGLLFYTVPFSLLKSKPHRRAILHIVRYIFFSNGFALK